MGHGYGFLQVQVQVGAKTPTGYLCNCLPKYEKGRNHAQVSVGKWTERLGGIMEILVDGYIQVIQEWGMVEICMGQVSKDRGDWLFIVIAGGEGGGAILGHGICRNNARNAGGTRCRDLPCMWYC